MTRMLPFAIGAGAGALLALLLVPRIRDSARQEEGRSSAPPPAERARSPSAVPGPALDRSGPGAAPAQSAPDRQAALKQLLARRPVPLGDVGGGGSPGTAAPPEFARAMQTLTNYDPRTAHTFLANQRALFNSDAVRDCGAKVAARLGAPFAYRGTLELDLQVADDKLTVAGVQLPEGELAERGDAEFRACYAKAQAGASFACPGCTPGSLKLWWPLRQAFAAMSLPPSTGTPPAPGGQPGEQARP
jgi:hypothetical protein